MGGYAPIREYELVPRAQLLWEPEGHRSGHAGGWEQLLQDALRAEQCGAGDRWGFRSGGGEAVRREIFWWHRSGEAACNRRLDGTSPGKGKESIKAGRV